MFAFSERALSKGMLKPTKAISLWVVQYSFRAAANYDMSLVVWDVLIQIEEDCI